MTGSKFQINDKIAIVTGGAGLLGAQHCHALIEAGAHVYVADVDSDKIKTTCEMLGKSSTPLLFDVTDQNSIKSGLEQIQSKHSRVDILVNNAAIDPKVTKNRTNNSSRLENFSLEQWNKEIEVGLTGTFLCCKIFGSNMAQNGGGCILNIASDLSVIAPDQRIYQTSKENSDSQPVKPITYSAIKTGLIGITRYLAAYWAEKKVRVNALSPGGVYAHQPQDFVKKLEQLIPMARMAEVDEYSEAVVFLCSDASKYMTGQNIIIDGGRTII